MLARTGDISAEGMEVLASSMAGCAVTVELGDVHRTHIRSGRLLVPRAGLVRRDLLDSVIVHAVLLRVGSYDHYRVDLRQKADVRDRYLTLEAARAASLGILPLGLQRRILALYGGHVGDHPRESMARARGDHGVPEPPPWLGRVERDGTSSARQHVQTVPEAAASPDEMSSPDDEDSGNTERSRILEMFSNSGGDTWAARTLKKIFGTSSSSEDRAATSGDELRMSQRPRLGVRVGRALRALTASIDSSTVQERGRFYPEWDCFAEGYRPNWCTVIERNPTIDDTDLDLADEREHGLIRDVARLGMAPVRRGRLEEGDDLDATALVEFVLERRRGWVADARIYEERPWSGRDLAVLVLLDASGSTEDGEGDDTVFEAQRATAVKLASSFAEIGDRVACCAFRSWGRASTSFVLLKEFNAPFDHRSRQALAGITPAGFTRMGAAVRHGIAFLKEHAGSENMVMIVIGDGLPYDDGYEDRYAREDTKKAFTEAADFGMGSVFVGCRVAPPSERVSEVWEGVPHRLVVESSELTGSVAPMVRSSLVQAASGRSAATTAR